MTCAFIMTVGGWLPMKVDHGDQRAGIEENDQRDRA